jgi:two-component system sensor histidine kinase YesM
LLYGGFAGFIVLLLVIVIGLAYTLSANGLARSTSYYQQELLKEIYDKLEIQLRSIEQTSLAASRSSVLSEYSEVGDPYQSYRRQEDIRAFLSGIVHATPIIHSIHYYIRGVIPNGEEYPVVLRDLNQVEKEYGSERAQLSDFAWIGEHRINHFQERVEVISFARKVYSVTGSYQGLLVLQVKASLLKDMLRGQTESSNRMLLDSGGRVITEVGTPLSVEDTNNYLDLIEGEKDNLQAGAFRGGGSFPKSKDFIVWANNYNSPWTLLEHTPWNQITSGSVRTTVILSLVGAAAIIIALFVTLYVSNQFVKPIRLLLHEMGGYTANSKKTSLPDDYRNEFGVLFSGYRKLIERIHDLYDSLEEQYSQHKKAEIKALQAMINPHFLYNTLDQLNWMAIESGQDNMSEILELMGKMFRIGLSNGESLILVKDELAHAECYLKIQQLRWGEGLSVTINVPDSVMELYIPKMTLQPFIENAILHGFHDRSVGHLHLHIEEKEDSLFVWMTDNGAGLRDDWEANKRPGTGGYGIRNVRERYEAFFAGDARIALYNNDEGSGTTVLIRFPVLQDKEKAERLGKRLSAG